MIDHLLDDGMLAVGALLILGAVAMFRHTKKFIARCRTAEGRITSYTTDDSDEGVCYYAVVRFLDAAGAEHEVRGSSGLQRPPKVGKRVTITYDPANPTNAWPSKSGAPWVLPWLVLLAGIGCSIAGLVIHAEG
jgi:hypothetical protein